MPRVAALADVAAHYCEAGGGGDEHGRNRPMRAAGRTILLIVCGGDKRTQATDIERAVKCWDDYQRRLP